ncbi:DUF397 domain-containing protein [Streptomyces triticagri]|uniref:DUF397 domain-containing protein n=1 Tax=Streptomyces triticagri TaxID=2293568 RepID=A0A372M9Z2_9ACTN|nr:DUF397 domain-containing protein [Streptomyces triticagri]RFU87752.1 DUF397 domain-containing protein [Streptomyces triticagri]
MIRETSAGDSSELSWAKSSYSSDGNEGDCVEVARTPDTVHIRDSKNAVGPHLTVTPTTWSAFITHAHTHEG